MGDDESTDLGLPLLGNLENFLEQMTAIRDLAEIVEENKKIIDDRHGKIAREISSRFPQLSKEASQAISRAYSACIDGLVEAMAKVPASEMDRFVQKGKEGAPQSMAPKSVLEAVPDDVAERFTELVGEFDRQIKAAVRDDISTSALMTIAGKVRLGQNRSGDVLYAALLTTAVSNFEVTLASLVRWFCQRRPETMGSDVPKLAWTELSIFDSIEELKEHYIDNYVTSVMYGGLDDWIKWFQARVGLKVEDLQSLLGVVREVFQ
jgi:hypothetical protein